LSFSSASANAVTLSAGATLVIDLKAVDVNDRLAATSTSTTFAFNGGDLEVRIDPTLLETLKPTDEFIIATTIAGGLPSILSAFHNVDYPDELSPDGVLRIPFDGGKSSVEFAVFTRLSNAGSGPGSELVLGAPRVLRASPPPVSPEPSTYALFGGAGLLLLAIWRKRRQRRNAKQV
jgi:hypothetical protein